MNTKYVKYALGEIVLVVIGILIALQINNWNVNRQQQKELQGYLEKIAGNMQQDMALAEEHLAKRDRSQKLCVQALTILKRGDADATVLAAAAGVFVEFYFIANKSGFEALKASGYIGKLKNNKVDSLLNEYYFIIERLEQEETSYNNFIESMEALWASQYSLSTLLNGMDILTGEITDPEVFNRSLKDNKEVLMAQPVKAVILRGATELATKSYYRKLTEIGTAFIGEVEKMK